MYNICVWQILDIPSGEVPPSNLKSPSSAKPQGINERIDNYKDGMDSILSIYDQHNEDLPGIPTGRYKVTCEKNTRKKKSSLNLITRTSIRNHKSLSKKIIYRARRLKDIRKRIIYIFLIY